MPQQAHRRGDGGILPSLGWYLLTREDRTALWEVLSGPYSPVDRNAEREALCHAGWPYFLKQVYVGTEQLRLLRFVDLGFPVCVGCLRVVYFTNYGHVKDTGHQQHCPVLRSLYEAQERINERAEWNARHR